MPTSSPPPDTGLLRSEAEEQARISVKRFSYRAISTNDIADVICGQLTIAAYSRQYFDRAGDHMPQRFSKQMLNGRRALRAARRRSVPLRALIPNIVSLMAVCVGMTSIRLSIEGHFDLALAAIAIAALLDGVDGRMARLLKVSSRFGAELDSLPDFVSFGVAPAVLLYQWGFSELHSLGWIMAMVFAIAAALRLARFNVALDAPAKPAWEGAYFVGVPVPAGAILLMLPLFLEGLGLPKTVMFQPVLAAYELLIAVLMVSRFRTFSGKLIGQRVTREYIAPVIAVAVALAAVLVTYPYLSLTVACLAYLASIPFGMRRYSEQKRAMGVAASGKASPSETILSPHESAPESSKAKPDKLETEEVKTVETNISQKVPQTGLGDGKQKGAE
jgi:CDP-diacylglycerol--serine O-phosphatidyltransferase